MNFFIKPLTYVSILFTLNSDEEKFSETLRNQAISLFTSLQYSKHIKVSPTINPTATSSSTSNANTTSTTTSISNTKSAERPQSVQSNSSTTSNKSAISNSERTPTPPDKDMVDSIDTEPKSIVSFFFMNFN